MVASIPLLLRPWPPLKGVTDIHRYLFGVKHRGARRRCAARSGHAATQHGSL